MTEYDYSPQAYERHVAKQKSIARWVDETSHYPLANPFLPSEALGTSDQVRWPNSASPNYGPDPDSDFGHSSSRDRRRGRDDEHHRHRSHHSSPRRSHSTRKYSRSSSSLPSPSTSYPRAAPASNQYPYPYASGYAQPQYPQDRYPSNATALTPPMSSPRPYTPLYGNSSPNQTTLVPIDSGAGGYCLVLPKGATYQVVTQRPQQSPSSSQPWYKRVFSPTPSATSSGKNKPTRSRSGGHKRRGSKWDWDIY